MTRQRKQKVNWPHLACLPVKQDRQLVNRQIDIFQTKVLFPFKSRRWIDSISSRPPAAPHSNSTKCQRLRQPFWLVIQQNLLSASLYELEARSWGEKYWSSRANLAAFMPHQFRHWLITIDNVEADQHLQGRSSHQKKKLFSRCNTWIFKRGDALHKVCAWGAAK